MPHHEPCETLLHLMSGALDNVTNPAPANPSTPRVRRHRERRRDGLRLRTVKRPLEKGSNALHGDKWQRCRRGAQTAEFGRWISQRFQRLAGCSGVFSPAEHLAPESWYRSCISTTRGTSCRAVSPMTAAKVRRADPHRSRPTTSIPNEWGGWACRTQKRMSW
jgi:hypothetical protein